MINSFVITNHLGESITLEMCRPEKSGFAITSVEGLGPSGASINTTEMVSVDGAQFNSARMNPRNVVFTLVYVDNQRDRSVEELRHTSYKYFPLKKKIKMEIHTDTRVLMAEGYVESNEQTIFGDRAQGVVSVACPDPYMYSVTPEVTIFSGVDDMFEFEFECEDIFEFGEIRTDVIQTVYYTGDINIGMTIRVRAIGSVGNVTIYNSATRESMLINADRIAKTVGTGIVAGDEIIITTMKGHKRIILIRDGRTYNILNCLDRKSKWLSLVTGDNVFAYTATHGSENILMEISSRVAYEGV